jgi:hypothetical protein
MFAVSLMVTVSVLFSFKSFVVVFKVSLIRILMCTSFISSVRNLYSGCVCVQFMNFLSEIYRVYDIKFVL